MGKHWIVLVNKSPRGPLSYEEVSTLLSEKILKRTDLALQVTENSQEEKSEWKFLWQYPEFDLRTQGQKPTDQAGSVKTERRVTRNPSDLKAKVAESIPEEIAMINPEDLVVSARKTRPKNIPSFLPGQTDDGVDVLPYSSTSAKSSKQQWFFAGVGMLMLVMGGVYVKRWLATLSLPIAPITMNTNDRAPAKVAATKLPSPIQKSVSAGVKKELSPSAETPKSVSQEPAIKPPTKTEISQDEYEKLKTERLDREKQEEDERRREEEEAELLAQSRADDQESEVSDTDNADGERELPIKLNKGKKKRLSKGKKRKPAETREDDTERRDSYYDRENAEDNEPSADRE